MRNNEIKKALLCRARRKSIRNPRKEIVHILRNLKTLAESCLHNYLLNDVAYVHASPASRTC